jgi:hypothetical protein
MRQGQGDVVRALGANRASKLPRHRSAILECEARRLARTLSSYGALSERQLFELSSAQAWERGTFAQACQLAVELGLIRRLGLGFYAPEARSGSSTRREERVMRALQSSERRRRP